MTNDFNEVVMRGFSYLFGYMPLKKVSLEEFKEMYPEDKRG